jgi:hypothetical protein
VLESTRASLTATTDKLSFKSSALGHAVIREQQMKIRLTSCDEKLTVANDVLDSAQQALSKRELSSSAVISLGVANVVALMKNHLLDLDMEILRKDFTIDDAEREILVNSAYDAAHDFMPYIIFLALLSPMITIVPELCNSPFVCYNKLLLVDTNFDLILLNT